MRKVTYLKHSIKGREWKNHKYIRKYLSKTGKVVYDYGNSNPDENGQESPYRKYTDTYVVNKNTWIRNKRSNTDSKGYGKTEYSYEKKDKKTGKTEKGQVYESVSRGKSFFSKKNTMIITASDGSKTKYVTKERGKLRQAAEKGADWVSKKLKRKK